MKEDIKTKIVRALSELPVDYEEQWTFIHEERNKGVNWEMAGVLVLLSQHQEPHLPHEEYSIILNKRSMRVQQPGDLCCPGGHPSPRIDSLLSHLVVPYLLPLRKSPGFVEAKKKGKMFFRIISFLIANTIRESWEEIRLNPFKVDYLGGLQCYRLEPFRRIIFPVVGILRAEAHLKPNWEVEKILHIPIKAFYNPDNFAIYTLKINERSEKMPHIGTLNHPCFVHKEDGQPNEILWGATYKILMSFMRVVFGFSPPDESNRPRVWGEPYPNVKRKKRKSIIKKWN
ncbi:MAG: CoA pyrophosphatase [Thermodesulfobacteriota bacterium]|nr:CoA pyrophosphatase [Thermodesulfobacteriota bacterium]